MKSLFNGENNMQRWQSLRQKLTLQGMVLIVCLLPCSAFAAETGINAWETILNKVATSLTGPVTYAISIIAIVMSGAVMAFADLQGGAKRFLQAACGLSIAFFAAQITTQFLGFSGAVI